MALRVPPPAGDNPNTRSLARESAPSGAISDGFPVIQQENPVAGFQGLGQGRASPQEPFSRIRQLPGQGAAVQTGGLISR